MHVISSNGRSGFSESMAPLLLLPPLNDTFFKLLLLDARFDSFVAADFFARSVLFLLLPVLLRLPVLVPGLVLALWRWS